MKRFETRALDDRQYDFSIAGMKEAFEQDCFDLNRTEGILFLCEQYRQDPEARAKLGTLRKTTREALERCGIPSPVLRLMQDDEDLSHFMAILDYDRIPNSSPQASAAINAASLEIYDLFGVMVRRGSSPPAA